MRTLNYIIAACFLAGSFPACSDNDHFDEKEIVVDNEDVEIVDMPIIDYLESQSSYSSMNNLFKETGIFDRMATENLQYTLFIVPNDRATGLPTKADEEEEIDEATFLARSHVSTGSLSPSSLKDGARVLAWNDKYLTISKTGNDQGEIIAFGGSNVTRIIKTTNGFVYELESLITTPKSLLQTIEFLGDDYSIFKEMVLSRNEKAFDKSASVPIGVDASGNTEYDSVFVTTNPYFLHRGVDITSESASFTLLIPSNELIENALKEAKEKLASWNMERPDSILENWCFQVAFFKTVYTREDFENNTDLGTMSTDGRYTWNTNVFGKQWRTTVNKVDLDNPVELSNGVAYYMTSLKIPTNVLIWRMKNHFKWYTYLSDRDKETYYILDNVFMEPSGAPLGLRNDIADWTPGDGWPVVNGQYIWYKIEDTTQDAMLEFTPYTFKLHDDGSYDIAPYLIPPGEYTLSYGRGKDNTSTNADIYFNDNFVTTILPNQFTNFNYDRTGGGYAEFYPTSGLATTYDRDGGSLGTVTVTGDQAQSVRIRFYLYGASTSNMCMFHWCLRPTENCY